MSDENYFKIIYNNEAYFQLKNSKNFFFLDNNFGLAESCVSKLKKKKYFSFGGFKFI